MSQFPQNSDTQITWQPGERFELALDSREGALSSATDGNDTLTVTSHRVIRMGAGGAGRTTDLVPLDRLSSVQVSDVARDNGKLVNGLIFIVIGLAVGLFVWEVFDHVRFLTFLLGGVPVLIGIYILTSWMFPDEDGALLLHASGHVVRQPLLTMQARHDAYIVANRIYELMEQGGSNGAVATRLAHDEPTPAAPVAPMPSPRSSAADDSSPSASLLAAELGPDASMPIDDVDARIAQSIQKMAAIKSYSTRQTLRDPKHETMAAGDYVWELDFVAPDRYRVSQTGWSDVGQVNERWLIVGDAFYRNVDGAWRKAGDPARFTQEQNLSRHLSPAKYVDVLKQGTPTSQGVDVIAGKRYLQVSYASLSREALAAVLDNPSPPQGVSGSAKVWVDFDTDLIVKAQVRITEGNGDHELVFEQAFVSYNAVNVEVPEPVGGEQAFI